MENFFRITRYVLLLITALLLILGIFTALKCDWISRECVENMSWVRIRTETLLYSIAFIFSLLITTMSFTIFWKLRRNAKLKLK